MWKIASVFWLLVGFGVNDAKVPKSSGRYWNIWTHTQNEGHAGTDASVHIILIDPDGRQSPPLSLENLLRNDFEQNSVDHFSVNDKTNIRDVCAIRIYHDNTGYSPNWLLEKVTMKATGMRETRNFFCNCRVLTDLEERASNHVIQRTPPCSAGPLP